MSGVMGTPFMGLMTGLYNNIMGMVQDDSDQPPDFEKSVRDHIDGIFGKEAGEVVARGIPRLMDFDMSERSGYQDLAPFTALLTDRQKIDDKINTAAVNFLGPAVGVGIGMLKGAAAYSRGNFLMGNDDALPAFARNGAKAWSLAQHGYRSEGDGNAPIPLNVSTWNVIAQAGGFGSGAKAEHNEAAQQWRDNQQIMQRRIGEQRARWLTAQDNNDPAGVGEAFENILKIARDNPQYAHEPQHLSGVYRQRLQASALESQFGARVSKHQIPFYEQFRGQGGMPTMTQ